jgi:DNA-directed RNA polymerase specialized sigma24 family protein
MLKELMGDNNKRTHILYSKHKEWLDKSAISITKNKEEAEDLLGDLYLYLLEKGTPKLYYADSWNLMYCYSYLKTRWINRVKVSNRYVSRDVDVIDEPYDVEFDNLLNKTYDEVVKTLKDLEITPLWPQAKLSSMYFFTDLTQDKLSKEIGISKSTTYLAVKKIKQHLKENIENPFQNEKSKNS